MGEMGAAGAAAAATSQSGRARAWLRRNFGSICAVGGGEASGRRAEAKLGHEAGRRIRARRRKPPALPAHARSPAGVERVAASRGGLARRERQRRGRSAVRRPRRTPLVEEYLYVFGFLMPVKHGGAGKRQRADGGCAAPGRRRPAQLVKPSVLQFVRPHRSCAPCSTGCATCGSWTWPSRRRWHANGGGSGWEKGDFAVCANVPMVGCLTIGAGRDTAPHCGVAALMWNTGGMLDAV